jgi:hypothetical protein
VYYKVDQSEDQNLKKKKKHRNNKSRKNKIEECEQGSPEVITLQHFISKENWEKLTLSQKKEDTDEGINKEEGEEIWGASCNMVYSSHDEDMPTLKEIFFLNDSGSTVSEEETGHGHQLWEEESDEEIIYHILKKPYKGHEIDDESEESFMINMGLDSGRDNPVRPRLVSEERLWRENFEARVWNAINEMRHQIKNNRREVSEQ